LTRADAGDLAAAEQAFTAAITSDPTYAPPLRLRAGAAPTSRFDEADRAVALGRPRPRDAPSALARVAGSTEDGAAGARRCRARAVAERYPGGGIWLDLGTLAGERADFAFARQCLERAVGLLPDEPVAWRNLAAACQALGDAACARRALAEALRLDPGNQAVRRQLDALGGPPR
jgi:tetratricopeptide (TPR) repeat protein